jgi:hypothetical protein
LFYNKQRPLRKFRGLIAAFDLCLKQAKFLLPLLSSVPVSKSS